LKLYELENIVIPLYTKSVSDFCCSSHLFWF
jgi:hypothetical protein